MRSSVGRAELLLSLAAVADCDLDRVAALLGYERQAPTELPELPAAKTSIDLGGTPVPREQPDSTSLLPVPYWRQVGYEPDDAPLEPPEIILVKRWSGLAPNPPKPQPLAPLPDIIPRLRRALAATAPGGRPDFRAAIRRISRGEILHHWPRLRRLCWPRELQVMEDFAPRLMPLWRDEKEVRQALSRHLPKGGTRLTRLQDGLWHGTWHGDIPGHDGQLEPGAAILVISDLGLLERNRDASLYRWERFALACRAVGRTCVALTPAPPAAYPLAIQRAWTLVPWERGKSASLADWDTRRNRARSLLALLSHAVKIPPGLMRELRRRHFPNSSAVMEIDLWRLPEIEFAHPDAVLIEDDARRDLHEQFRNARSISIADRQGIFESVKAWCGGERPSIYLEAVLSLGRLANAIVEKEDLTAALDLLSDMTLVSEGDQVAHNLPGVTAAQVDRYLDEMRGRTQDAGHENPLWREAYSQLLRAVKRGSVVDGDLPPGFNPKTFPHDGERYRSTLMQVGGSVRALNRETFAQESAGSPLAEIATRNGVFSVWSPEFWKRGEPPSWASGYGTDKFGPWVEFTVSDEKDRHVVQRMRWIPPGTFQMGSPEIEPGREENEGPQHEVQVSQGYWFFDTPVMQALWEAVLGNNPSRFVDPKRSVEQVSWDEASKFIEVINQRVPGLDLALPAEAQWEYACRAGTETATYEGPIEILGANSAPILDPIAWYGGNSGVDFELENGADVSWLPEKQYEHNRAGTRAVALKLPNGWGLYDMLGNVWEWCADDHRSYSGEPVADPVGSLESDRRALRGGSWHSVARFVRAASRLADLRVHRDSYVGFRCARVREGAEPAETGPGRAERQTAPARQGGARLLSAAGGPCATSAQLLEQRGFVVRSDCETLTFETLTRPDWANAIGRDRYGLWTEFNLGEVTQRLRWIGPGRFTMGAPEDEPGRSDREGPQHEVRISKKGYWLFDTPVTQGLWEAVTGGNPSRFVDPKRPVERVSWDDAAAFLEKINAAIPELDLTLPTEAQWEYACRAGTETATYAGPMAILGQHNAPVLDEIAWYGGNSGVGFELDKGHDSSDWPEKQYDHSRAGTGQVGKKKPNAWGLYDMLGNVWEWCADDLRPFSGESIADPVGSTDTTDRALRGGSWLNDARSVRAASRRAYHRDFRFDLIGFRCARVRE